MIIDFQFTIFFAGGMTVVSCGPIEPGVGHVVDVTDDIAIILSTDQQKNPGSVGVALTFKNNHNNTFNLLKIYTDGLINTAINKNVDRDQTRSTIDQDWTLTFFLDDFNNEFCRENNIKDNDDLNNYYQNKQDIDLNVPISFKISALKDGNLKGEVSFTWSK